MAAFSQWGKQLGCDFVIYERVQNWHVFTRKDYAARAVHFPDNPLHREYQDPLNALFAAATAAGPVISHDLTKAA